MSPILSRLSSTGGGGLGGFGFGKKIQSSGASPSGISAGGGNATFTASGYSYHVFTSPGPFNVTSVSGTGLVDVFLVAGGGAGGYTGGGGGGAGGAATVEDVPVSVTGYTITIGPGGPSNTGGVGPLHSGSPTTAIGYTVNGGGGGASGGTSSDGGSGGGGDRPGIPGGAGNTPPFPGGVQGYDGGTGNATGPGPSGVGGGGGGAGGGGTQGDTTRAGDGGSGIECPFGADIPASYGTPGPTPGRWFAGGGGGGAHRTGTAGGNGGVGGGGAGQDGGCPAAPIPVGSGQTNTGSGGGGSGGNGNQCPGGTTGGGGPGIVIIRYVP